MIRNNDNAYEEKKKGIMNDNDKKAKNTMEMAKRN